MMYKNRKAPHLLHVRCEKVGKTISGDRENPMESIVKPKKNDEIDVNSTY